MGKGSSSSETSQATTSSTTDVSTQSGIAIGPGGSYVNDFGTGAQSVVHSLLDFSGNVLNAADHIISQEQANALQVSANSLQSTQTLASNATQNAQLGQTSILTNPATLTAIVAVLGLVAFMAFKRRG